MAPKFFKTEPFKGPLMRVAYAWQLFKLRADPGKRATFGCSLIAPKTEFGPINQAVMEAIVGQWGDKGIAKAKNGLLKNPVLAGDGKEAHSKESGELHKGMGADVCFVRANAGEDHRPKVIGKDGVTPLTSSDELPSGSWVYPVLNAYTWHNDENGDGVSIGIYAVQLARLATGDDVWGGSGGVDTSKFFEAIKDDTAAGDKPADASSLFA